MQALGLHLLKARWPGLGLWTHQSLVAEAGHCAPSRPGPGRLPAGRRPVCVVLAVSRPAPRAGPGQALVRAWYACLLCSESRQRSAARSKCVLSEGRAHIMHAPRGVPDAAAARQVRSIGKRDCGNLFKLGDEMIQFAGLHGLLAASVAEMLPVSLAALLGEDAKRAARAASAKRGAPDAPEAATTKSFEGLMNSPWKVRARAPAPCLPPRPLLPRRARRRRRDGRPYKRCCARCKARRARGVGADSLSAGPAPRLGLRSGLARRRGVGRRAGPAGRPEQRAGDAARRGLPAAGVPRGGRRRAVLRGRRAAQRAHAAPRHVLHLGGEGAAGVRRRGRPPVLLQHGSSPSTLDQTRMRSFCSACCSPLASPAVHS